MEVQVVKPWEEIEPETEDFGMTLRGRLPRQQTAGDDGSRAVITTPDLTITASKFEDDKEEDSSDTSSDVTQSSDAVAKETPDRNGVLDRENGHGNGVTESTQVLSGSEAADDRYVDFLAPEEAPVDRPASESEPRGPATQTNVEVKSRSGTEIEAVVVEKESQDVKQGVEESVVHVEARLRKKIEEEFRELYLDKLSDKTQGHQEFYCPTCKACITKVLVRQKQKEQESNGFICTSCFSFLIPIGNWLFPKWGVDHEGVEIMTDKGNKVSLSFEGLRTPLLPPAATPGPETTAATKGDVAQQPETPAPEIGTTVTGPTKPAHPSPWRLALFGQKPKKRPPPPVEPSSVVSAPEAPSEPEKNDDHSSQGSNGHGTGYDLLHHHDHAPPLVSAEILPGKIGPEGGLKLEFSRPPHDSKKPELDLPVGEVAIDIIPREPPVLEGVIVHGGSKVEVGVHDVEPAGPEHPPTTSVIVGRGGSRLFMETGVPKSWEIVKSIVYGGLVESITSLGIVTSAASSGATTLNIVALALANLVGGLFLIGHNIWELRDDQFRARSNLTSKKVNKYEEVLGRREDFYLHATCVILSFILFGLIPPVVYGFTFRDSKDLKIAAVGVTSMICIAILAIGKAYTQRPSKYFKTLVYYLVAGFGVSGASYLAGVLISKLLEKIESSSNAATVSAAGLWGSY